MIGRFIDMFLHLDVSLGAAIHHYGHWVYLLLFLIIFCETGLVVTPFLPGDSLLFAAGMFSAARLAGGGTALDIKILFPLLCAAAVTGNMLNYQIGYFAGPKVFHSKKVRLLNRKHLEETHSFFQKYGPITLVIARFLPIIRTFAPFLAGVGRMGYMLFSIYNAAGCLAWVSLFIFGGYFFGNIPLVRNNFTTVIMAIIVISVLPSIIAFLRGKAKQKQKQKKETQI